MFFVKIMEIRLRLLLPSMISMTGVMLTVLGPATVRASAFQVDTQSATGLGRAMAGEAVIADDASVMARNPAAMTLLGQHSVGGVLAFVSEQYDADGVVDTTAVTGGPFPVQAKNTDANKWLPGLFYSHRLSDRATYGLGLFSGFWSATQYPSRFEAVDHAQSNDISSLSINPNFSWRFNSELSVGVGLSYFMAESDYKSTLPNYLSLAPLVGDNLLTVTSEGSDWGYNLGVLWSPDNNTRFGIAYRSEFAIETDSATSDLVADIKLEKGLSVKFPNQLDISVLHQLNEKLALHGSITRFGWSSSSSPELKYLCQRSLQDTVLRDCVNPVNAVRLQLSSTKNWENTLRYALGLTYTADPQWTFRAGIALDESPVPDQSRGLAEPYTDSLWLSLGLTWRCNEAVLLHTGYAFVRGDESPVNSQSQLSKFTGKVSTSTHLLAAQISWFFK
jgi:long-chain fatty acid transport protein